MQSSHVHCVKHVAVLSFANLHKTLLHFQFALFFFSWAPTNTADRIECKIQFNPRMSTWIRIHQFPASFRDAESILSNLRCDTLLPHTAPSRLSCPNTAITTDAQPIFYSFAVRRPSDVPPSTHIKLTTLKTRILMLLFLSVLNLFSRNCKFQTLHVVGWWLHSAADPVECQLERI